jgi:hypothetical protein
LLAVASAVAAGAEAEYRCNAAAIPADKGACVAAEQGPDALRRYVQRMRSIQELYFYDYVNRDTLAAWDRKEMRERASQRAETTKAPEVVRNASR